MPKQLTAAFARAWWQAVLAAVIVYFGTGVITNQAADNVADQAAAAEVAEEAEDPAGAGGTPAATEDEAPPADDPDTEGEQILFSLSAGGGLIVSRALLEGLYDAYRNATNKKKKGDVTGVDDDGPPGLRVKVQGRGDDFFDVVGVRRTGNTGATQYLITEDEDTPIWKDESDVTAFQYGP